MKNMTINHLGMKLVVAITIAITMALVFATNLTAFAATNPI